MIDDRMDVILLEINGKPALSIGAIHSLANNNPAMQDIPPDQICYCNDCPSPHVHAPSAVDKKIKTAATVSALVHILDKSQHPLSKHEKDELQQWYCYLGLDLPLGDLDLLCDVMVKIACKKPVTSFMVRRLMGPWIKNMKGCVITASDVDSTWRVHQIQRPKLYILQPLQELFHFVHLVQEIVEKAMPQAQPVDALRSFLSYACQELDIPYSYARSNN